MNISALTHQQLFRPGSESNGCTVAERYSVDFLIDGESLLRTLVKVDGGHADFMGCFVKGFAEPAARKSRSARVSSTARASLRRI